MGDLLRGLKAQVQPPEPVPLDPAKEHAACLHRFRTLQQQRDAKSTKLEATLKQARDLEIELATLRTDT